MTQVSEKKAVNLQQEAQAIAVAAKATTESTKKDAEKANIKEKEGSFGEWWDKNKNWLIPLLALLVGGAAGYAISNLLSAQDSNSVNQVLSNINLNKKEDENEDKNKQNTPTSNTSPQEQKAGNGTLSTTGQQVPTTNKQGTQATGVER